MIDDGIDLSDGVNRDSKESAVADGEAGCIAIGFCRKSRVLTLHSVAVDADGAEHPSEDVWSIPESRVGDFAAALLRVRDKALAEIRETERTA